MTIFEPNDLPPASPRVLICDDEAHILHAVAFKLSAAGIECVTANNGREAIATLETMTPDLVITDYQMPFVDGMGLCRFLRGRPATASVPIIMLTAKALELNEEKLKAEFGISAVFMKPFSPRALLGTVQSELGLIPSSPRAAAEPAAALALDYSV